MIRRLITRHSLFHQVAMVLIGFGSIVLALVLPQNLVGLAGFFYFVTLPYFTVSERIFAKRQRRLADQDQIDGELDS